MGLAQVTLLGINMRITILLLVICLTFIIVEGQKGKGKGKGKGNKPSKGKPSKGKPSKPEPTGSGEEPTGAGSNEEIGECPEGERPCPCKALDRKGKKPKPSKGKGKGKGKGNNSEEGTGSNEEGGEGGKGGKGGPGGQVPEPRGYCIDEEKLGAICIAGSAMEEKAEPAWEACKSQCEGYMRSSAVLVEMRKGKGKGKGGKGKGKPSKGKGKPSKCPTVATIIDETAKKFACEICHFTEMGWIDSEMVADETMIEEDIMTLPPEISEALSSEEYGECMTKMEETSMDFHKKCMDGYSEEE